MEITREREKERFRSKIAKRRRKGLDCVVFTGNFGVCVRGEDGNGRD